MNIIKKLINLFKGYNEDKEDKVTYEELLEENELLIKNKMDIFRDFLVLLKLIEKAKINGSLVCDIKNKCSRCAITSLEYSNKKECFKSDECMLIKSIDALVTYTNYNNRDSDEALKFSLMGGTKKEKEKDKNEIQISISLLDKINKLKNKWFTSDDFIKWLENERLNDNDFNYLFSDSVIIKYPEIMKAAKKRKKELKKKIKIFSEEHYLNSEGNPTWCIKNISPNHVAISDLDIVIKRGAVSNLLCGSIKNYSCDYDHKISLDIINNSYDLKRILNEKSIIRITEQEYLKEVKKRPKLKPGMK
jgi:hypothetical protein